MAHSPDNGGGSGPGLIAKLRGRRGSPRSDSCEAGVLAACLGPLELKVLDVLWRRGSEAGVRSITGDFPGVAYTTLMTTLDRLYKKDLLVRRKVGRAYVYAPRYGRAELEAVLARDAVDDLLGGDSASSGPEPVLVGFVEAVGRRDARMLDELERLVRSYRSEARRATPIRLPGWPGPAWLVESGEAGICITGFRTPGLLISRRILDDCTGDELARVVAHELAHARARDLWKRLLLRCVPDFVQWTVTGSQIERVWRARAEEEADMSAVCGNPVFGFELAGALVKIARRRVAPDLPLAIALDAGGPIERRVRLLLAAAPPVVDAGRQGSAAAWLAIVMPAILVGAAPPLSIQVHRLLELVVKTLT